jgi:hypothetical protein
MQLHRNPRSTYHIMACDGEILVSLVKLRPSIYDFGNKDRVFI